MFLIAGLGNPGLRYFRTRHNIGFMVIDKLAEFLGVRSFDSNEMYLSAPAQYKEHEITLIKPLTYMNLSGRAVKEFSDISGISNENTLIIFDDVNLDFGTLRLRPSGSDGGHNGMKSIIYEMISEDIPRLRIGINNETEPDELKPDEVKGDLVDFVLEDFTEEEQKQLPKIIECSKDAVLSFIEYGITETMNNFNRNVLEL